MVEKKDFVQELEDNITYVFKIKYNGTEANKAVHEAFKQYCLEHTDNSYIMGIKRLLEHASSDWKYEFLYDEIKQLREDVDELLNKVSEKEKVVDNKVKNIVTFGGEKNE